MSEIRVTTLKDTSGGNSLTTAQIYNGICRVWVNWYVTGGTPTIRDSYNVSSLTDNGSGDATINFTSAIPNEYACTLCYTDRNLNSDNNQKGLQIISRSTTTLRVSTHDYATTREDDHETSNVAIFSS